MITHQQIKSMCINAKDDVCLSLEACQEVLSNNYEINTPLRMAHFLAQTAHESGGFRVIEENLNYKIFYRYFKDVNIDEYAHNPEKIANRVYANRMGNGSESSGDGYKFKGRGLIQLTGRYNYEAIAKDLGVSLEDCISFLETPEGAIESAAWFWKKNNINKWADQDDVRGVTKKVNGGEIGLDDRQEHTDRFKELLGA